MGAVAFCLGDGSDCVRLSEEGADDGLHGGEC